MSDELERLRKLAENTLQERERIAHETKEANAAREHQRNAGIETLATQDLSMWTTAFRRNMATLQTKPVKLYYRNRYGFFGGVSVRWNSRALEYGAPNIDFRILRWNNARDTYAQKLNELLGKPLNLWHCTFSGHIPHRKGSQFYGLTDELYEGSFDLSLG